MNSKVQITIIIILSFLLSLVSIQHVQAQENQFVLVIDPGHGGHDPGAVGKRGREKDIVLSVSKLFGGLVEKNMPDVKVVYTRKTDVFIPLQRRANIANTNKADLFVSIHVNAAKNKTAYGAETFTLGLAKTQANLDVAMKENAVILLEDDYQTTYKGFDPKSIDSYIMFEFMMDTYLDNSIDFATDIQRNFVNSARRFDRGVKQAEFWVLHRTAAPSVLVELGFISNANEEQYLLSEKGQRELSTSMYNAFVKYKKNHDLTSGQNYTPDDASYYSSYEPVSQVDDIVDNAFSENITASVGTNLPVFKLQIFASSKVLKSNDPNIRGLNHVDYYKEGNFYKYTIGADSNYQNISKLRQELKGRFPDAFVIAFYNGKKINTQEALKMVNK